MSNQLSMSRRVGLLPLATVVALGPGCQKQIDAVGLGGVVQPGQAVGGGTVQVAGVQPVGNFLPKPSLLVQGGPGQPDLVYINPEAVPASYRAVLLEPVSVLAAGGSQLEQVPPDQQGALAQAFYTDLRNALSQHCTMTDRRGPGTIALRFALIGAHVPNAAVNTMATYTPYASTVYDLSSVAFNHGVGYFAGSATAEAYGSDAKSGKILWQAVDKRAGTTAAVENTLDTWLDIHHAFENWSMNLATKMVRLGYCQG